MSIDSKVCFIKKYDLMFSDGKIFSFSHEQLLNMNYFCSYLKNSSAIEINRSSIGFEILHFYATTYEIEIYNPGKLLYCCMVQSVYFGYDKLTKLLISSFCSNVCVCHITKKYCNIQCRCLKNLVSGKRCKSNIHECTCLESDDTEYCRSHVHSCICSIKVYDRNECRYIEHSCTCLESRFSCNSNEHKCICLKNKSNYCKSINEHECVCSTKFYDATNCRGSEHPCICLNNFEDCRSTEHKCICLEYLYCCNSNNHDCICSNSKFFCRNINCTPIEYHLIENIFIDRKDVCCLTIQCIKKYIKNKRKLLLSI